MFFEILIGSALMPSISIYTDKASYKTGEKMHLGLDIKNTYTWHAILDDTVTGEIISEDTASWYFKGKGASTADIADMIERTAIEFSE